MGNSASTTASSSKDVQRKGSGKVPESAAERVKKVVGDVQEEIKKSVKGLDDHHPAAQLIDSVCGMGYFDDEASRGGYRRGGRSSSFYSDDNYSEDGSRTVSEDDTYDDQSRRSRADNTVESQSYISQSDYDSDHRQKKNGRKISSSFDTEDESRAEPTTGQSGTTGLQKQPLASSFAKRCYFTKAGIGRTTQHYEGLTLTGNIVLMLAASMKLKGCPTICDEDLRRVEQTYPNQFSRLPDELLLSSGWRRISKYCHFSNKPVPDGVPFFHSKQRLHPSGGYYFLLAAAVGMTRPMDVERLSKDTLVLVETDFPAQCDAAPNVLVKDPDQWTLVNKFCFFSGGPINTEEDVYYQADFDGNPIYMLAFLSPSLTAEELYKLGEQGEPSLMTLGAVQEVESVYDLTVRDFDDLKLYHLGPCRALPQYILQPQAWTKILPPHFLAARQQAMIRAEEYMQRNGIVEPTAMLNMGTLSQIAPPPQYHEEGGDNTDPRHPPVVAEFQRQIDEEGAFHDTDAPMDEAQGRRLDVDEDQIYDDPNTPRLDPPDDEPPSLQKGSMELGDVPDPDDPSVMMTPMAGDPSVMSPVAGDPSVMTPMAVDPSAHVNGFFPRHHDVSPQQHSPQQQQAVSPDGEQLAQLISLGTAGSPPQYDPFDGLEHPQDEFGFIASALDQEVFRTQPGQGHMQQHQQVDHQRHFPKSPPHEDDMMYGGEEKKIGIYEAEQHQQQYEQQQQQSIDYLMSQGSAVKSGEEDFIAIKRDGYQLSGGSATVGVLSPQSAASEGSHASAALRGAQEILKKNRRRRQEMNMKQNPSSDPPELGNPASPKADAVQTGGNWDSGSDASGSNVTGSSLWSSDSGSAGDRSSRRALILQMAKARMRSNKDSPSKPGGSVAPSTGDPGASTMIEEETNSIGGQTETAIDIDFSGELD